MACGYPISLEHHLKNQSPLRFRADGTFRILHLTDIHEVDPEMDDDENPEIPRWKSSETMHVIEECIERADPDLVVFGGDNISGYWEEFTYDYMVKTIRRIIAPVAKRNIPLAIVFGNHDSEGEEKRPFLRRENHINIYAEYPNFRGCYNEEDVHGCCNCSLPILAHDSNKIMWNIWCIDSNDYVRDENHAVVPDGGYDTVHPDQIAWYEKKAAELKVQNGGKPVPAILFQHMPVLQEYDFVEECSPDAEGAFEKDGKYLRAIPSSLIDGVMREGPCPPMFDDAQFKSWQKTGDIVAAFFGHDHTNTFTAEKNGIKLIQTIGAGYHSYGLERGGRLIVLNENSNKSIETHTIIVEIMCPKTT